LVFNMSTVASQRLPLISVIIPTYNRAALLRRAIDSVYAQEGVGELFDVEILVIDDGSTDTTPAVASSYAGLRYIRPSANKGTSGARNVGLDAAVGEYVAFLDDDDSWLPWKLRRQLQALEERSEVSLVYGQEVKRSDRAVWVWPDPQDSPSGWMHRSLLLTCPVNTSSVLIRRSHVEAVGRFDERLRCWEDYDMWLRLSLQGPFRFLSGPAVIYQVASSGRFLSSVLTGESERDLRNIVKAARERLRSKEEVSDKFRAQVEAGVVTRISGQLLALQESSVLRTYLARAVQQAPWLVGMTELRWMLSTAAVSTGAPELDLDGVRDFCAQIKAACAGGGPRQWTATRRLEAEIWRKVAVTLAAAPKGGHRQAVKAAVRSVSQHPATFGRALLRIFVGAAH
jgi:glycosyltransferase involved in cell wall biosynthesis